MIKVTPQERGQDKILEQIVDVLVLLVMEEIFERERFFLVGASNNAP